MSAQTKSKTRITAKVKRNWTLQEAAEYLSAQFNEPLTVADILELVRDGQLKLSISIPNYTKAVKYKVDSPTGVGHRPATEITFLGCRFQSPPGGLYSDIRGIFLFPMLGGNIHVVDYEILKSRSITGDKLVSTVGILVESDDGETFQLIDFSTPEWQPALFLPSNTQFLLRSNDLDDFLIELHKAGKSEPVREDTRKQPPLSEVEKPIPTEKIEPESATLHKRKTSKTVPRLVTKAPEQAPSLKPIGAHPSTPQLSEYGYLRLSQIIGDKKKGVKAIIPVSKSAWLAGVKSGQYPPSIKLGPRTTAWKASDIKILITLRETGTSWADHIARTEGPQSSTPDPT